MTPVAVYQNGPVNRMEMRRQPGFPCAICKKPFDSPDDVVYCPDCREPYHKDCWAKIGRSCKRRRCQGSTRPFLFHVDLRLAQALGLGKSQLRKECNVCHASVSPLDRYCTRCGNELNPPHKQRTFVAFPLVKWIQRHQVLLVATVLGLLLTFTCALGQVGVSLLQQVEAVANQQGAVTRPTETREASPTPTRPPTQPLPTRTAAPTPTPLPTATNTPRPTNTPKPPTPRPPTKTPTPTPTPSGPLVVRLVLIDAQRNREIGQLQDGATISLSQLATQNLDVRAITNPAAVGSVKFTYDGQETINYQGQTLPLIENVAPYAMMRDNKGDYKQVPWLPTTGEHKIVAVAYSGPNATGRAGPPTTVIFYVEN